MMQRQIAYLALGSNQGDRLDMLRQARRALAALPEVDLLASSSLYESPAQGGPAGQPDYLNAILRVATGLSPEELLARCLEIEARLGRVRRERWGPRLIDIDLLLVGDRQFDEAALTLPHPRLAERPFVLLPLRELAAGLTLPGTGRTVAELTQPVAALPEVTCRGAW